MKKLIYIILPIIISFIFMVVGAVLLFLVSLLIGELILIPSTVMFCIYTTDAWKYLQMK